MKPESGRLFAGKGEARQWVWDALQQQGLARPPLPPHRRIPNFVGARSAAQRLFLEAPWRDARAIKVNPDTPQRYVRRAALERGIRVYVPSPRLQGGFLLLDPERIPARCHTEAADRATMDRWALPVALRDMPPLDGIVTGCVAVTPTRTLHVAAPPAAPERVEWERLPAEDIEAMPLLRELRALQQQDLQKRGAGPS